MRKAEKSRRKCDGRVANQKKLQRVLQIGEEMNGIEESVKR